MNRLMRAIENPITELQADPVATDIVLGTPHPRVYPGSRILPRKPVGWKFRYWQWDAKHLVARDTERPMGAPIKSDDFHSTSFTDELKRFSFMSLRDDDEFEIADSILALRAKHGVFARMIVESNIERLRRDAILNASYPSGHVITLASGDEFNSATGGSLDPIQTGLNLIASKTGWAWNQIEVFLPYDSFVAAITDPLFRASRQYSAGTANPTVADLQAYWGSGTVWTENVLEADEAGTVSQMWGDVAILYGTGTAPDMDTEFGLPTFGRTFGWNKGGIASVPQKMPLPLTATAFPWTDYAKPKILVPSAGVKIVNTKA